MTVSFYRLLPRNPLLTLAPGLWCLETLFTAQLRLLNVHPGLPCNSPEYDDLKPIIIVLLVLVVILAPLALLFGLIRNYKTGHMADAKFGQRYGVL
jgi:hypothetical protein